LRGENNSSHWEFHPGSSPLPIPTTKTKTKENKNLNLQGERYCYRVLVKYHYSWNKIIPALPHPTPISFKKKKKSLF